MVILKVIFVEFEVVWDVDLLLRLYWWFIYLLNSYWLWGVDFFLCVKFVMILDWGGWERMVERVGWEVIGDGCCDLMWIELSECVIWILYWSWVS